jgi:hypothetical protein
MRFLLVIVAALALSLGSAREVSAAPRVALVIGNSSYPALPEAAQIEKAVNDAVAIGDALRLLGFDVIRGAYLSQGEMLASLVEAAGRVDPGGIVFFYFAGQGFSVAGRNYLLPSDIPSGAAGEDDVRSRAVAEEDVVRALAGTSVGALILVLDASRPNPFRWQGMAIGDLDAGLSPTPDLSSANLFRLYAASYGTGALESLPGGESAATSPFAAILSAHLIAQQHEPLILMATSIAYQVAMLSGGMQTLAFEGAAGTVALAQDIYVAAREPEPAPALSHGSTAPYSPAGPDTDLGSDDYFALPDNQVSGAMPNSPFPSDDFIGAMPDSSVPPSDEFAGAMPDFPLDDRGAVMPQSPGPPLTDAEPAPAPPQEYAYEMPEPQFPWPPPQASASYVIPRDILIGGAASDPTWGDVERRLQDALDEAGYFDRSFFFVPSGFAMVTRLEQIDEAGNPVPEPDRWPTTVGAPTSFSLANYISELFFARAGYYRVIVFIATPLAFVEGEIPPTADEATAWVQGGLNTLPTASQNLPYTDDFTLTALIYEFQHGGSGATAEQLVPSRLPGRTHLERGRIISLLGE